MHEAILYDKLDKASVHCRVCPRDCRIAEGKTGFCCVRKNENGQLFSLTYGKVSSAAVDPIEKKPLYHFYPGSRVFSIGGSGCNMRCIHCQNWQIAHERNVESGTAALKSLSPEQAVAVAKENECAGIAWTYNEPTIWLEYTIDTAKLCRAEGLYTAYVTNGYATQEAVDAIGPYLDAYRVDVKGFSDEFYGALAGISNWRTILAAAERAKKTWGCHVEIVTNIIPTMNDDKEQLTAIAAWIRNTLGPDTPWHVTRFMPYLELSHLPVTPVETLERAREIGMAAGLRFVYIGNVPGHPAENTRCPQCGHLNIERSGYRTMIRETDGSACANCGRNLNIIS